MISLRYWGDIMERRAFRVSGFIMIGLLLLVAIVMVPVLAWAGSDDSTAAGAVAVVYVGAAAILLVLTVTGLVAVNPNQARVLLFFGRYVGTISESGFHWT